jgi:hypothetical protein
MCSFLIKEAVFLLFFWGRKRHDERSRHDVLQRRFLGFKGQMDAMTDAYMHWGLTQDQYGSSVGQPEPAEGDISRLYGIDVMDVFGEFNTTSTTYTAYTTRAHSMT